MRSLIFYNCVVILISSLALSSCAPSRSQKDSSNKGELIFQSGFENESHVVPKNSNVDIIGTDRSVPDHNNWVNDLDNHPNIGNFNIQYEGGDSTTRHAKIIPEPGRPNNHVLEFLLKETKTGDSKGRIQGNLYGNNGLTEIYQSVRVFLHDDFNMVREYPKEIHWLTIAEFWNNITWSQAVPFRFRITLGIGKLTKSAGDLYFILDAEDCQLFADNKQKYTVVWAETNQTVKVPIGKWFTMDYYYKEGGNNTGRFYLSITPQGGRKQVIFDVRKITHNTQDTNPDGLGDFNPIKLYTSKDLVDFMKGRNKVLQVYWDDLKLWKNKTPD